MFETAADWLLPRRAAGRPNACAACRMFISCFSFIAQIECRLAWWPRRPRCPGGPLSSSLPLLTLSLCYHRSDIISLNHLRLPIRFLGHITARWKVKFVSISPKMVDPNAARRLHVPLSFSFSRDTTKRLYKRRILRQDCFSSPPSLSLSPFLARPSAVLPDSKF